MNEYASYLRFLVEVWQHKVVEGAQVDPMLSIFWSVSGKDWATSKFFALLFYLKLQGV